jgi:hypothetical protein
VRVVLRAPIDAMRSRISPSQGLLEAIDDRSCRLTFGTSSLATTATWLAGLEIDFAIVAPAELQSHVRLLCDRLQRAVPKSRRGR